MTSRRFAMLAGVVLLLSLAVLPAHAAPRATHTVTFDRHSLLVDGRRTYVWSGEFHPFRLPSPDLWRDVLEKMRAEGYDAVSVYFDWNYHSPAPGVYDFTGVRDMDRLLDIADRVGIYVIARPGPYINAEVSGGGFPGWLTTQVGRARTAAPDYLAAADDWLHHIDAILARHQLTDGRGTVILYQIENELAATGSTQRDYLANLHDTARADGITVPIFHNDKGRNGTWVPPSSTVPGTVPGPVDLYAFDGYPGGSCHTDGSVGSPNAAPDWGLYGTGGAKGGASASPETPGFTAEFGGGWFDYWGSVGTYPCTAVREGPGYERVFYGTNIANGLTMQNVYMTAGGTSWGWLPAPVVYSSYDYGAAIDEARQLRPKATTMRELGYFLAAFPPAAAMDRGPAVTPSATAVKVYHNVDPDSGAALYVAMHNPSSATTTDPFTFPLSTPDGSYTVPRQGTLQIAGQDAKFLVADADLDGQHLVYSTSNLMTHLSQRSRDVALFYAPTGDDGETVLRYASQPTVTALSGQVASSYDPATGDLRLDYRHAGLTRVAITGGGRKPLLLLLADEPTAGTFWRQDTGAGPVLERGPELVRAATAHGATLALTGDTTTPTATGGTDLEVWAPPAIRQVTWNRAPVPTERSHPTHPTHPTRPARPAGSTGSAGSIGSAGSAGSAGDSLVSRRGLAGPLPVALPDLTTATWRVSGESPEARPSFDDSGWAVADKTTTNSTTTPPAGQPVLTADDYGFHTGDVWYRGRYTDAGAASTVSIRYGGGGAGLVQAWLDGTYLGQNVLPTGVSSPPTTGTATFTVPEALRGTGDHVLSVMVRDDSHNEDGGVNDAQKEGRGIISAGWSDPAGAAVTVPVGWRIQGGDPTADRTRGPLNNGGLYGERAGWYLSGYRDAGWARGTLPAATAPAGTSWYRTTFRLTVPAADDASLGLTIGDPGTPRSSAHYRALIFMNGWNVGQYIADVGPQHTFPVPTGILDPHGTNTVAIAVTSDGGPGNGLEPVHLTDLGTVRGGVPVHPNR
jgi:beta-galactosidase GanA